MKKSNRSTNLVKGLKVIQGKGFTRLKINGSTLTILDAPPKNNIDGHLYCNMNTDALPVVSEDTETLLLELNVAECERYYEINPSLIFADIESFRELYRVNPGVCLYGINPTGSKGWKALLDKILSVVTLSIETRAIIKKMSVSKGFEGSN